MARYTLTGLSLDHDSRGAPFVKITTMSDLGDIFTQEAPVILGDVVHAVRSALYEAAVHADKNDSTLEISPSYA